MGYNVRSLIGKLNEPTRLALEAAAGFCLSRTHYDVEIEHFLMKFSIRRRAISHASRRYSASTSRAWRRN